MQRALFAAAAMFVAGTAHAENIPGLRYVGQYTIPTGASFDGTQIGGLSGIDFDAASGTYYSISDDRSALNPSRFYNLSMNFDQNGVYGVTFNTRTDILRPDGSSFPINQVDPEAIRRDPSNGNLFWTSEGERVTGAAPNLQNPFVREMNATGGFVRELATPSYYNPTTGNQGIQRNLAFESLSLSTDGTRVITATENSLFQDGPAASVTSASPSRVMSFDKATGQPLNEWVYITNAVGAAPSPAGSFATNGLVEILEINPGEFLTVERSFSTGVGNSIQIYKATTAGATDIVGLATVPGSYTPMTKTLLFNLDSIGITLDNIEGITLGPVLPDGTRSVVLVSDNNFSATQFTQFIVLAVPAPSTGALGLFAMAVLARRRR